MRILKWFIYLLLIIMTFRISRTSFLSPADKRRRRRDDKKGADVRMKRMVFDHYLRYPQSLAKAFFQPDMLHPNARGHVS
jgi:hypothetical protein